MRPLFFPLSALPCLLFLFFSSSSSCVTSSPAAPATDAAAAAAALEEACLMAWKDTPRYKPCVTALRWTPESRNATLPELAVLSTSVSLKDARDIADRLNGLLLRGGGGGGVPFQEDLATCLSAYEESAYKMQFGLQQIRGGKYGAAGNALVSAACDLKEPTDCTHVVGQLLQMDPSDEVTILLGVATTICSKYSTEPAMQAKDCLV